MCLTFKFIIFCNRLNFWTRYVLSGLLLVTFCMAESVMKFSKEQGCNHRGDQYERSYTQNLTGDTSLKRDTKLGRFLLKNEYIQRNFLYFLKLNGDDPIQGKKAPKFTFFWGLVCQITNFKCEYYFNRFKISSFNFPKV